MKRTVNLREMSASSPLPSQNQEAQTKKIMFDLQQEKKRLQMLQQGSGNASNIVIKPASKTFSHQPQPIDSSQQMSINQRNALQMANSSCFGYFISQASSFGNIILPVIPRVGPNV